jgi:hypothetical protein
MVLCWAMAPTPNMYPMLPHSWQNCPRPSRFNYYSGLHPQISGFSLIVKLVGWDWDFAQGLARATLESPNGKIF